MLVERKTMLAHLQKEKTKYCEASYSIILSLNFNVLKTFPFQMQLKNSFWSFKLFSKRRLSLKTKIKIEYLLLETGSS